MLAVVAATAAAAAAVVVVVAGRFCQTEFDDTFIALRGGRGEGVTEISIAHVSFDRRECECSFIC